MKDSTTPDLTGRQSQILAYIQDAVAARGYPPSVREIGEALHLSSPSTVHFHLSALVKAGYLRRDPTKPRAIEVIGGGHEREPSVRQVPILGAEDVEDVLTLPTALVGRGQVFMLRIKGDSMIEAGILDGDLVVIESGANVRDGEIVAALIDKEEATVKTLRRRGGKVILEPANSSLSPVTYDRGVDILGRVVSVIRSL